MEDDLDWLFNSSDEEEQIPKVRRVGRPSIVEKKPEIVDQIREFIEQSTAGAHLRRRSSVMYTNGVTLRDISEYMRRNYDVKISKDTIHKLLLPPRKKTVASRRYKSVISARVPPKRNDAVKITHPHFHYTSAQINLVNQLAEMNKENTLRLSVDNKNKLEIGNPAVNRRCQVRKFHLINDSPNNWDHDFPYRNTKLTPAGYQILKFKPERSRSLSPPPSTKLSSKRRSFSVPGRINVLGSSRIVKDKIGRNRVNWPRTGPLTVQLYPCRAIESTSIMHMHFLLKFIKRQMKAQTIHDVVAIADGGPDWSVKGIVNLMSFGILWKNLNLDSLIVQCYAPGHSRFNPIERTWSLLTKLLVGVILPVEVEELGKNIPKEDDDEGWNIVLDNAIKECGKFWHGKKIDGFKISVEQFLCNDESIPRLKSIHNLYKNFADAGKKKLDSSPALQKLREDYIFYVHHCHRKPYQLEFTRCENTCCGHCSIMPTRENDFLRTIKGFGGSLPIPKKSDIDGDHFRTLQELLYFKSSTYFKAMDTEKIMKESCPFNGCNYTFFSKADEERHNRMIGHKKQRIVNVRKEKYRKK